MEAISPTQKRLAAMISLAIGWAGFCYLRYHLARERIMKCMDKLSITQQYICIRHVLEQRERMLGWRHFRRQ